MELWNLEFGSVSIMLVALNCFDDLVQPHSFQVAKPHSFQKTKACLPHIPAKSWISPPKSRANAYTMKFVPISVHFVLKP